MLNINGPITTKKIIGYGCMVLLANASLALLFIGVSAFALKWALGK